MAWESDATRGQDRVKIMQILRLQMAYNWHFETSGEADSEINSFKDDITRNLRILRILTVLRSVCLIE